MEFLEKWAEAANTSFGFFWMAFWAFGLGYLISSLIQIFATEEKMKQTMGGKEGKGVLLGTIFGFISSSCSFSALATTKSLFKKGASFISSIAFLLASTNLVIELGIIISIFLGWQFVVGEYLGGILLILISWIIIRITKPLKLIKAAKKNLSEGEMGMQEMGVTGEDNVQSEKSWAKVGRQYGMEWKMVWKDVTIGFTIAGIVAALIPDSFFQTLFINSNLGKTDYSFLEILEHVIIGPIAAFLTFIGSMGNIPLAALLFGKGVSFAGVMAFIFSDLVVFPVLRINAKYYGWKMALYILFLLLSSLVVTSIFLHYSFDFLGVLPDPSQVSIQDESYFQINYTFFLNVSFLIGSGYLIWLGFKKYKDMHYMKEMAPKSKNMETILKYIAFLSYIWLLGGLAVQLFII
ncbi:permease [Algoriphagus lutimaris]|uniref:permease n=1 Tax=Algoriphagus lutimaris TaxID=613197 RepID=UPI001A9CB722|nr:permease [Algoriphagus lutimaris]